MNMTAMTTTLTKTTPEKLRMQKNLQIFEWEKKNTKINADIMGNDTKKEMCKFVGGKCEQINYTIWKIST